jgi:hypothetical protein
MKFSLVLATLIGGGVVTAAPALALAVCPTPPGDVKALESFQPYDQRTEQMLERFREQSYLN